MIGIILYFVGTVIFFFGSGLFLPKSWQEDTFDHAMIFLISFCWPVIVGLLLVALLRGKFISLVKSYMEKRKLKLAAKKDQLAKEKKLKSARIEPDFYPPTPQTNYREMNCKECGSEIGDRGKVKIVPLQEALKLPKVKQDD